MMSLEERAWEDAMTLYKDADIRIGGRKLTVAEYMTVRVAANGEK